MGRSPRSLLAVFALVTLCVSAAACGPSTPGGRIFVDAEGHAGVLLRSSMGGPYTSNGPACAFCHGNDGNGGRIGPSITRATLGAAHTITHMRSSATPDPAPVTEGPWTATQTVDVVRTGLTPEGNHLGGMMPRWRLDSQDASALAGFLKGL